MKYQCDICTYQYDPVAGDTEAGIAPGTPWADVPDDWVCPDCGALKTSFSAMVPDA